MRVFLLLLLTYLLPASAQAWWSEDWPNRVKININAQSLTELGSQSVNDSTILVRLHTGNFADFFYFNQDVSDLRFISADDATPLKFHVEKFDLINQLMFIWVKIPQIDSVNQNNFVYMYYGNQNAVSADDKGGSFAVNKMASFHFDGSNNVVIDSSAYSQKAQLMNVERKPASLIGSGLAFNGEGYIGIVPSPSFQYLPGKGFAFSTWIKPQASQANAIIFSHKTTLGELALGIDEKGLYAKWQEANGSVVQTPGIAPVTPDTWQHVALNLNSQRLAIFINGIEIASANATVPAFDVGELTIGGDVAGNAFTGEMDEVSIYSTEISPQWFLVETKSQSQTSMLINMNTPEQEGGDSGTSYFATILNSVSLDGWVVIGMLMLMAAVSWMVMVAKAISIRRMEKDNKAFMEDFHKLKKDETGALDASNDEEYGDSDLMNSMFGKHDHYQSAPNFHLYHQGVHELNQRMGKSVGASAVNLLSPQSISAIRATLDASLVRESQKLNSKMVLLTIAIAGGPFLGLLGTVLGVMITFAAIAASGNVDINAIAPGVSAALMTTVAGLFVAIPALFGYNYLSVRIKDMMFDMDVFVDEFITKIAEQHS